MSTTTRDWEWGMERLVASVIDQPHRITHGGPGQRPHIDGRDATDAELRHLADLLHGGLAETTGTTRGAPLLTATPRGTQFATRWANLAPYRTETVA